MIIEGKKALITGGGAGFGLCLTQRLIEAGASVIVLDNNASSISALEKRFPDVRGIVCDVGVDVQIDRALNNLGEIDILVNNAGLMKSSPLVNPIGRGDRRHSRDLWQRVMRVNLDGVFFLSSTVAERMVRERRKGVIVNVTSIAAQGNAGQSAYAASKAAVESLTKVWAKELGLFGIRCAAISPGFVNTKGTADAIEDELLSRWVDQVPLRRLGEVNEVVDAIFFIINNDFFNGRILHVDGGLVI